MEEEESPAPQPHQQGEHLDPPEAQEQEKLNAAPTAVIDTNMRQRRMALVMGILSLITAGVTLMDVVIVENYWLPALLLSTGIALMLYWKTGFDPKGYGKAIWGKNKSSSKPPKY